ncbi:succinate semialdehyde dehydrogenase NADP+ linked [Saitoella coloradoensis]
MVSSHQAPKLKDQSLFKQQGLINGQWADAQSGETFTVTDPVNNAEIGTCPEMTRKEVAEAIDAARKAFADFRNTTPRERSTILKKWHQLCMENADDLAKILTWENGKPLAEAQGEVKYGSAFFEWFAEEAVRLYGDVIPSSTKGNRIITLKQPVGVVGIITPWNFPIAMITRKVGAAVAAGCTVVCKPGAETPYSALALAELGIRAGLPAGVFNIVTGEKNTKDIGLELTTNPSVRKISFTGSTAVGKILMQQSASTLKKCSFELGGNAPFIVFDDADIDLAVAGAIACKFRASGQTCVCANRIYVQKGIYDKFAKAFVEKVNGFKLGSGFDPDTTHGPLIHDRAVAKVKELVDDATSKGAKVLTGGEKSELGKNFWAPTVLGGMTNDMRIAKDEIFGAVAPLFEFESEEDVIALANDTDVGLAGYFYSNNVNRIWRVAEALEVGMVGVNCAIISDAVSPFGGVKESGFGREGSKYGLDEYTVIKSVTFGNTGAK